MGTTSQVGNKNGELPESAMIGPFGGIQSELPPTLIEKFGFSDALNILFRLGRARVRPAFNSTIPIMPPPLEPWLGISDFFNTVGDDIQVAVTPTRLFKYDSGSWVPISGTLTGGDFDKFSFATVAEKLCFCQGVDKVQLWDGIGSNFADASGDAVPAKYMFELANHLVVMNTIETGPAPAYQRVRWTGAGDPTDWVSFNAGQIDLFNDLGPINGGLKLYQAGYIFQQRGIVQLIPTGVGTNPFADVPLSTRSKGLLCPWSLSANGDTLAAYVGQDNIYAFDGTNSNSIGDMPLEGRARVGARTRIFSDLLQSDFRRIFGFTTSSINGNNYNSYWLVIPNIAIWVYNYDEKNWTRWSISGYINYIGTYIPQKEIRIIDLIGTIAQQLWTFDTINPNLSGLNTVMLGFADGSAVEFDFSGWSEQAASLTTGQMSYQDSRHDSVTKTVRMVYTDNGPQEIAISLTSETGQVSISDVTDLPGTAGGKELQQVFPVNLPGNFATLQIDAEPGTMLEFSLLSPRYSQSGEVKTKV